MIVVGVAALFFSMPACASAEPYVGIILDGFQQDCAVQSKDERFSCGERRQLYTGDRIVKLPSHQALKIKWAPYANGEAQDATTLLVTFKPPANRQGILQSLGEMIGFVKTKHIISAGATRGGPSQIIQPCGNATVIQGQQITFMPEGSGDKQIVFKDSRGKEIFRKGLQGAATVQLTPEEIGLKPVEVYTWNCSGAADSRQFAMRLLTSDIAKLVAEDLKQIEKDEANEPMKSIKKAAYLQFMSDAYPVDIDLYWLSSQIVYGIKENIVLSEDDKGIIDELTRNCRRHVAEKR